jgi:TPR repeat protein
MYENGQGVSQDYHKAMEFYLKSANQENANAQFNIGIYSFHSNLILTTDSFDLNRSYVSKWTRSSTRLSQSNGILSQICKSRKYNCSMQHWYSLISFNSHFNN